MKIDLVFNKNHYIHHIKEKDYAESPDRISSILDELDKTGLFTIVPNKRYKESRITAVHKKELVTYLKKVTQELNTDQTVYPEVFPVHRNGKIPKSLITRAGYYCIDADSPINRNAYLAAREAVNCALTGAELLLKGSRTCYALVRPPGHHADSKSFGGFCYLNSTAIAAHYLSEYGKVAILDIDYHHGNGQEEIFYNRSDVLTVSIHGDPDFEYPHFSGFHSDTGCGAGIGFNVNYPLPKNIDGAVYQQTLKKALGRIKKFKARFLVIAFGLDTALGDPYGSWLLNKQDFRTNGEMIGTLDLPTLLVQEGGYNTGTLGTNALYFFQGFLKSQYNNSK